MPLFFYRKQEQDKDTTQTDICKGHYGKRSSIICSSCVDKEVSTTEPFSCSNQTCKGDESLQVSSVVTTDSGFNSTEEPESLTN